ncbi:hypothetical protein GOP47_0026667 [Adiantum capillus-veneris]|nr:hypothetical protein GOP47_0026667 [Adiantum capillus-veneris]
MSGGSRGKSFTIFNNSEKLCKESRISELIKAKHTSWSTEGATDHGFERGWGAFIVSSSEKVARMSVLGSRVPDLSRSSSFPTSFIFGVATSSVQIEGATCEGGRGKGVWDTFGPGKTFDGSTPAIACDHFHKFKEDIANVKKLGLDAYRFSISWPRLFPESSKEVNAEGVAFYNNVINCVVEAGLTAFVTLYHWDLPQFLQDDPVVKGWGTKHIIGHFVTFANTCFKCFGDRVKYWITLNEIHMISVLAYGFGLMAPGKSDDAGINPYTTAHHQLLCHAAVVRLYRTTYQKEQQGWIGMSADISCYEPMSTKQEDVDAALRCEEFEMGWILDPVHFGDYPQTMKDILGERLPTFSKEESADLKESLDFIGLNYYFTFWATNAKLSEASSVEVNVPSDFNVFLKESQAELHWKDANENFLGELSGLLELPLFRSCPWGLRKVLAGLKKRYGNTKIYITENGTLDPDASSMLDGPLNDTRRIKYLKDHLSVVADSIRVDKVMVEGYFYWTFMDSWEWASGFMPRFGLHYIDFNDPKLLRIPKASATWLSCFLKS